MTNFTDFGVAPGNSERPGDRSGSSREIHLSDGNSVRVVREDPYGFWYIKWFKGATPDPISGSFTTAERALKALDIFLNNERFKTERVETPVVKTPPLQYKKAKNGELFSV